MQQTPPDIAALKRGAVVALSALVFAVCGIPSARAAADRPRVSHYRMTLRLEPHERSLRATTVMTVVNTTHEPVTEIPFLLYRLFTVDRAEGAVGERLDVSQTVVIDRDEPTLQVNSVQVRLPRALAPGDSTAVTLVYGGRLFGYTEVSGYVHDTVSEDYSLLREDSYAYPILARPSREGRAGIVERPFTWELIATVPAGYVVATGGEVLETQASGDSARYTIRSRAPTWRLDIAAAKFARIADAGHGYTVYVLPGHDRGGARVLEGMQRVVAFYSRRFGDIGPIAYTAIEIPDGWGSQAGPLYLLQTAAAFTDSSRINEVYHEIGHSWNAASRGEVQRCRWFDEAFASYFESLALGEFRGPEALRADMEASRAGFRRWVDADSAYARIPIVEYGAREVGGLSYTKGAWALHVLRQILGDDRFDRVIRELLREHRVAPAGFEDFRRIAERVRGRSLDRWYREWFLGTESSRLLLEGMSVEAMAARYR